MLGFMHILEIFFHPQKFGTNFGRELKMLGFMHILEICFQPPNVWLKYQDISENVGFFLHILEICFQPPNVWHKYRERIQNLVFFTHPSNMLPPPKYLAQISG